MIRKALLLSYILTAACNPAVDEPGPGGVSAEDARSLDKAAVKLDAETSPDSNADLAD